MFDTCSRSMHTQVKRSDGQFQMRASTDITASDDGEQAMVKVKCRRSQFGLPQPPAWWIPSTTIEEDRKHFTNVVNDSIFVGIASYRDIFCSRTIENALRRAHNPTRLVFGPRCLLHCIALHFKNTQSLHCICDRCKLTRPRYGRYIRDGYRPNPLLVGTKLSPHVYSCAGIVDQLEDDDMDCGEPELACNVDPTQLLCIHKDQIHVHFVPSKYGAPFSVQI